jgi:hypothetical protein
VPACSVKGSAMKLWTLTPPRSNARVAAVIADAFASAKAFDPLHEGRAPRDVANALRFAMSTEAGAYLDGAA